MARNATGQDAVGSPVLEPVHQNGQQIQVPDAPQHNQDADAPSSAASTVPRGAGGHPDDHDDGGAGGHPDDHDDGGAGGHPDGGVARNLFG